MFVFGCLSICVSIWLSSPVFVLVWHPDPATLFLCLVTHGSLQFTTRWCASHPHLFVGLVLRATTRRSIGGRWVSSSTKWPLVIRRSSPTNRSRSTRRSSLGRSSNGL